MKHKYVIDANVLFSAFISGKMYQGLKVFSYHVRQGAHSRWHIFINSLSDVKWNK